MARSSSFGAGRARLSASSGGRTVRPAGLSEGEIADTLISVPRTPVSGPPVEASLIFWIGDTLGAR
jgi:hypothetical protein